MKFLLSTILLGVTAMLSVNSFPQSSRSEAKTEGKKNQRPETAPTPLAIPQTSSAASSAYDDGEVIRVNTQLVSVPVRVMDKKGRFIGGLEKENFKVFENGKEQEITLFANENEPFTVALVLDMSYSTKFKIGEIQSAAIAFIDQLRPQDRVMVVSFDQNVLVLCEATSDRKEIYRAIKSTKIATGTSLYEAIDLVMNDRLNAITGRKAIILFSDGVDTTSRRVHDLNNLHDAMEQESIIYTIRYDTFADVQKMKDGPIIQAPKISIPGQGGGSLPDIIPSIGMPSSQGTTAAEYEKAAEYLEQLAFRTGGRRYDAITLGILADAYSKIASELREFYSVGYYPREDREQGKTSSVKVRVDRDGVVVRARENVTKRRKVQVQ